MRRWIVVCLLAWLSLGGCRSSSPALPALAPTDTIVAFGDSLTFGSGAADSENYPAVLSTLIGRQVVREGVPGETTEQGLARLPQVLEAHRPRLLLLCLGGNDMLHKVDEAVIEEHLRELIQLARGGGAAVVMIGVPRPALWSGTAAFYRRVADELKVPLEEKILTEIRHDNALKSDTIHPNAAGYRRLAQAVATLLHAAGAV
jgi:lysophospholipase L1-like esterase